MRDLGFNIGFAGDKVGFKSPYNHEQYEYLQALIRYCRTKFYSETIVLQPTLKVVSEEKTPTKKK